MKKNVTTIKKEALNVYSGIYLKAKLRTAIYIRVSTAEQAKEGFSIPAQIEKLKNYAIVNDWDIIDFYIDDGKSGKDIEGRPEVQRLIADVNSGKVNNVLVYKLDRLTRSVKNLIELIELFEENNCCFNSLTEKLDTSNAVGRMFIKIIGIFAEFERENLAERVAFGYEQKTREGNYTNCNGVYGYDYIEGSGELVINEEEKQIILEIFEKYLNGYSMTQIVKDLISKGIPTKRNGKWCQSTICSILTNPLYIGKIRYKVNGTSSNFEADGKHTPFLDEEIFYRAQEIIKNRKRYQKKCYPKENTYFLGSLFCAKCGAKMGTNQHKDPKSKTDTLYVNYYCYNSKNGNCDCHNISQNKVEAAFLDYMSQIEPFQPAPHILEEKQVEEKCKELKEIEYEITKVEKRIKEIKTLFLKDEISIEEYQNFRNALDEQLMLLRQKTLNLQPEKYEEIDYERVNQIIGNIKENWVQLSREEKKEFLFRFVSKIQIYSDKENVIVSNCEFYNTEHKGKEKTIKR
ncbi:recombinase family protein [bacterium 1XD42-1]|nr:recombinase family protein [bacterium 1XD42-8]RKJ65236.1 recombinase family protein [bacterium 1XD42-1]